jgi:uncharacterized protein
MRCTWYQASGSAKYSKALKLAKLALFGSIARDEGTASSDVDILVSFDGPATSERYFGVQFYLEDQLGLPVDLVTDKALRDELKSRILKEALYV